MHTDADIPTIEPAKLTAGDTVKWKRALAHYKASEGWVLTYALRGAGNIDLTASADGDDHLIEILAATSTAYTAGIYSWQAYATKGAERFGTGFGRIEILPNLAAVTDPTYEHRSEAKVIYDQLVAAYKSYTGSRGGVQQYTIGTRQMTFRSAADFIKEIEYWRAQVEAEEIAAGLGKGRNIFVRFRN